MEHRSEFMKTNAKLLVGPDNPESRYRNLHGPEHVIKRTISQILEKPRLAQNVKVETIKSTVAYLTILKLFVFYDPDSDAKLY